MKFGTRPATHDFGAVAEVHAPRSQFDMSFNVKTAFNAGYLVPIFAKIAYPGDTFNIKANCFAKLSTPIVPIMDGLYLDVQWWSVPWRQVWDNFQKFMGEQDNPADSISYTIPQTTGPASGYTVGSLQDYLGLPTLGQVGSGKTVTHNNLIPRAYARVWNKMYRDENMQNSITEDHGDGPDTYSNYVLQYRGKRKDYFSGALPFLQKGTAVSLPLGGSAIVRGDITKKFLLEGFASGAIGNPYVTTTAGLAPMGILPVSGTLNTPEDLSGAPDTGLIADLTTSTGANINAWRLALQTQAFLERDARYGSRYIESNYAHFGVVSSDARLNLPEYLGGNSTRLSITPVAQTSNTPASGTPQGNLAAYGLANTVPNGFVKSFEEHCIVLGLVSVRAQLSYQQGLDREWTDQTRLDMYFPDFANIGEQAILTQEIYCTGDPANDLVVFGYQERFGHMRWWQNKITGIMRSTAATPLDIYHLAQKFTSAPVLGATYVQENPPIARVVAVPSEPNFIFDGYIDAVLARRMPTRGIPGSLKNF